MTGLKINKSAMVFVVRAPKRLRNVHKNRYNWVRTRLEAYFLSMGLENSHIKHH